MPAHSISNAPMCDWWTCPVCFAELPSGRDDGDYIEGDAICPTCDEPLHLSIELQPVHIATCREGDDD